MQAAGKKIIRHGFASAGVAAALAFLLQGCANHTVVSAVMPETHAKHMILIIGDGFQLEHERAFNNYMTGSDKVGLRHWQYDYKGVATTWDITTYNRFAYTGGAQMIGSENFDPKKSLFAPARGYDPRRGGVLPYPMSKVAAVNSRAAKEYFGTRLQTSETDKAKIPATDSAAAATALATGFKTEAGNLAWRYGDKPNGRLKTIAEMMRSQKHAAIGVVSTVPFSHATPAGFVSHNTSRKHYHAIAREIITETKPDVVIGGGHPDFNSKQNKPDFTYIGASEYRALKDSDDYVFVERKFAVDGGKALLAKAEEAVAEYKKLFGLFGGESGNFEYHQPSNNGSSRVRRGSQENPELADAAIAALTVLSQNPNGFFLMVEQGDIDWANHANSFRDMIGSMWDLDQTVRAVEDFVNRPGDDIDWSNTILIVTTDHANSFMRINKKLAKGKLPVQKQSGDGGTYGGGAYYYPHREVTYGVDGKGVDSHFNEPVTVYAKGPASIMGEFMQWEGRWYPGTRLMDNTQIFEVMKDSLGLADENRQ